jgi:hypothetical protein
VELVVDHQHLLNAVLVQQVLNLVLLGAFLHSDQALLRRHDFGNRRIHAGLETQIPAGHDTHQIHTIDHRHAGDVVGAGDGQHLANAGVRRDGHRIGDNPAFVLLDQAHLLGLGLDAHVLVNDPDAAFLGHGDSEARLGDRVHGRRDQRNIEGDAPGQTCGEIHILGQHRGMGGQQEDVVEGEGFLYDAHRPIS